MSCILEPDKDSKECRKNWVRLIQKIHEVDPLTCPKCQGRMCIIAFIEDVEIIEKILKHLGLREINPLELWRAKARPPPRVTGPPKSQEYKTDYSHRGVGPYGPEATSQLPVSEKWLYVVDPEYPEAYSPLVGHPTLIFQIGLRLDSVP